MPILAPGWKHEATVKRAPTRDGFGDGLVEAGRIHEDVMTICADLTESTRCEGFKKMFPDRFVELGVSEQSLAAIGAGMCLAGKQVFIASYACFSPGRNWEQIRTTACLQETRLRVVGAHAGVSVGPDGATHQMLEDIALMRVLPNMIVLVPCDAIEARKTTIAAADAKGPVYLRFAREKSPIFTTTATPFEIGKATVLRQGKDVALIGCGPAVYECLLAAEQLAEEGIEARVINNASVKPMDEKTILAAARDCGAIVTAEEAQTAAGMGSSICEFLAEHHPIPIERIGIQDQFGQSGTPDELLTHYGLRAANIVRAAKKVIKKKHK